MEPQVNPVQPEPQPQPKVETVNNPVPFFNREPVAIAAAVRGVLYVAILFGFDMSAEQMTAIVVAIESILALITRQQVTPYVAAGTTPNVADNKNTPQVG